MNGLRFECGCANCGDPLTLASEGGCSPERRAALECHGCGRRFILCVQLVATPTERGERKARQRALVGAA